VKPALKVGLVSAGYVGAFLVASMVVAIRVANTSGPEAQASSGMYAFGDSVLFIAVFGVLALLPTGVALHWLRSFRGFWVVLSILGLCVAITGVVAAALFTLGRNAVAPSTLATGAAFSVLRILLAPVLVPVFLSAAFFTPYRAPRIALGVATVVELAVLAFSGVVWFVPLYFQ
jgi:hypothetical protein